jgi:hypothetical protein
MVGGPARVKPGDSGSQGGDSHRRFYQDMLKMSLVALGLATVALFLAAGAARRSGPGWHWLTRVPFDALAETTLSVTLIGVIYEWLARREFEKAFEASVANALRDQGTEVVAMLAQTLLTDRRTFAQAMSVEATDELVLAALDVRLGGREVAADSYQDMLRMFGTDVQRWSDYRIIISLSPVAGLKEYFDAYLEVEFDANVPHDEYLFGAVGDPAEYERMSDRHSRTSSWQEVWSSPATPDYPQPSEATFELEYVKVGGREWEVEMLDQAGMHGYRARLPVDAAAPAGGHRIHYRFRARIATSPHVLALTLPYPTRNVEFDFSADGTDIYYVNTFDHLVGSGVPVVTRGPSEREPTTVRIEKAGWVLPRSGVVFGWILQGERPKNPIE